MSQTTVLYIEENDRRAERIEALLAGDDQLIVKRMLSVSAAFDALSSRNEFDVVLLNSRLIGAQRRRSFPLLRRGFPEIPLVIIFPPEKEDVARSLIAQGADECLCEADLGALTLRTAIRFAGEHRRRVLAEQKVWQTEQMLETASQVQRQMLPNKPPQLAGFDIAGACRPAAKCAGDFYDFIEQPNGSAHILIGDVTSHGFAPALLMADTRRLVRELAQRYPDLGELLTLANEAVVDDSLEGQFVTIFLCHLDPATRGLTYAAAGHGAEVIAANGEARRLASTHPPLGLLRDMVFEVSGTTILELGDVLVLMTDGISEARHPGGELFGKQRALQLVHERRDCNSEMIVSELLRAVEQFCFPNGIDDDATVVVLKSLN